MVIKVKKRKNAKGHYRDPIELWLDKHNHLFALMRTIFNMIGVIIALIIWKSK